MYSDFMLMLLLGAAMGFVTSMPPMGPIGLLVLQRGFLRRYREALAVGAGGAVSEVFYCSLAAFGVSALLEKYQILGPGTRAAAGLILVALGIYFIRARGGSAKVGKKSEGKGWTASFILGLSVSALNPTLVLTWSGNFAVLYSLLGLEPQPSHRLFFPAGVGLGMIGWYATLVTLQRKYARNFSVATVYRIMQLIGWILLLVGTAVAVSATF